MDPENPFKAQLRPRREGESLKVAETVLKRRDRNLKANAQRAKEIARIRKSQKDYKRGKLKIVRAEKLIKDSRMRTKDKERLKTQNKKKRKQKPGKGKVVLAFRNGRKTASASPVTKAALKTLGMLERHSVVFLPNTKETVEKLHEVRPFVFWGAPTLKVISNIMTKKALFKDGTTKKRIMLSDNTLVEEHLGDLGLLCVEDMVHAIYRATERFPEVLNRLWPINVGDARKATSMVFDKEMSGDLAEGVNSKISELLGL
eukprot:TRINITY_DN102135_c0_g1_i1.p1 TRINITY_DN102135_c0_g1~~TRINITY_DN102135_c0_g1_i1.p1  ORF type:complete len:259 (-),score=70.13 TRINITY_DN102135_c0_g1_i1:186-962(-)